MGSMEERALKHYGIIRRSGRYPYGSGGNAYQGSKDFKASLDEMRNAGLSDPQIADAMDISTTDLRDRITKARQEAYGSNVSRARGLKDKGTSTRAIAEIMLGDPKKESTVRGWLNASETFKENSLEAIANILKGHLGTKRWLDVGKGTHLYMGISKTNLRAAVSSLKDEGYKVHSVKGPQLGTGELTNYLILGHPDSTWNEAKNALNSGLVYTVADKSLDGGLTFLKPKPDPVSVSSSKIKVRYAEDGGDTMDGVLELRRGVPHLDLGANHYAQVRVAVDGTHYLKGMAMYADDLPIGTDIRFNTNKPKGTPLKETSGNSGVLKPLKTGITNVNNPFGATARPQVYVDSKGVEHTSALNIVNKEGTWDDWSRNLSSQLLSKQSLRLATTQLAKAYAIQKDKFDTINALTNPVVKKQLLKDFAKEADAAAVSLKAAALPRQLTQVLLPMNSMRPNEVYAPQFDTGERVALVRHPHSGPFEIPQLIVNNNNTTAKRLMGGARDAIGIHHSVAQQLSGADFDGDAVVVIPNNSNKIKSRDPLDELKDFNPKYAYPETPGMKYLTPQNVQREMGTISNLITDMSIKGAPTEDIAKAVKHSMVVIDAEKHNLNYKLSEKENSIAKLKTTYQSNPEEPRKRGASTLISRASSEARIPQERPARASEGGRIDPATGKLNFVPTNKTIVVKVKDPVTGKRVPVVRTDPVTGERTTVTKLAETKKAKILVTDNALTLSSGEPMEEVYGNYANSMKNLANEARKTAVSIKDPPYSPQAKAIYSKEVASLTNKLKEAQMNAPLERRAQAVANATSKAVISANPQLDKDQVRRVQYQSLADARAQIGASKKVIGGKEVEFTDREWEAVQSGAISSTMLGEILSNSDVKRVKELATPRYNSSLTTGQIALAKSMAASGRSLSEISSALGIPRSTISDNLKNA